MNIYCAIFVLLIISHSIMYLNIPGAVQKKNKTAEERDVAEKIRETLTLAPFRQKTKQEKVTNNYTILPFCCF